MNNRAKWAYLSYDSIIAKIQDGTLDEYDVVYTKDTHENYVISPELEPWAVRSRVYVFSSEDDANEQLNINTDTYVGQIVSIIKDEKCKGYIVNKNQDGVYYVEQLSPDNIDYNTLGNRPIENLTGTLDNRIIATNLPYGIYKIKGTYKISELDTTAYLSADGDLVLVGDNFVSRITNKTINKCTINDDGEFVKETYVTDRYLIEQGYVTTNDVDSKIAALEESIKEDIETYVENIVEEVIAEKVNAIIDEQLEAKLEDMIQEIPNEEVQNLFD